ncbi:MAG: hypothetical protein J6C33_00425 [Lachnospiraceae bacterium]|nr:hypothetical protein [Lachnospiraceae bacterium]
MPETMRNENELERRLHDERYEQMQNLQDVREQEEMQDQAQRLQAEMQEEMHAQEQIQAQAEMPLLAGMPVEAQIEQEAPPAQVQENRRAHKIRSKWKGLRILPRRREERSAARREEAEREWQAQRRRAQEADRYAKTLPVGTEERAEALQRKEELAVEADYLRRKFRVMQIENEAERKREEKTLKRHAYYDSIRKAVERVKADNPLAHEEAEYVNPQNGHKLVNIGRAFFGGTKPMYIFEDRNDPIMRGDEVVGYRQYLFKKAVNCLGFDKPEGALVTEAAANLQRMICGEYAIPAFAARVGDEVVGSFQVKLETWQEEEGRIDLFAWQANPKEELSDEIKREVLREHTLDWLLCNFDTKGENFLHRADGHLSSFDKEASFGKLKDDGARRMSTTYQPHANNTLYNVLFTEFAEGRQTLDLDSTLHQIRIVEGLDRQTYLGLFNDMLTEKYGRTGRKRRAAEEAIWARKDGLMEEYRRFYGELIARRRTALVKAGREDDFAGRTDQGGRFLFAEQ